MFFFHFCLIGLRRIKKTSQFHLKHRFILDYRGLYRLYVRSMSIWINISMSMYSVMFLVKVVKVVEYFLLGPSSFYRSSQDKVQYQSKEFGCCR